MNGKKIGLLLIRNFEEYIAAAAMFIMTLLTCINVLGRYIFDYSIAGIDEPVLICFAWATFLGASACYKRNMHYGIDMLVVFLPNVPRMWLIRSTHLLLLIVQVIFAFLSWQLTAKVGLKTTFYYGISYRYVDFAAVLGFACMAVHSARYLIRDFRKPDQVSEPLVKMVDYVSATIKANEERERFRNPNTSNTKGGD